MTDIREIPFEHAGHSNLGIETLTVENLQRRECTGNLQRVQRIQFFLLLLYTRGISRHTVDFMSYEVRPNTLILVRPGQVQQFHLTPELEGQLIVVDPSFLIAKPSHNELEESPWWKTCSYLSPEISQRFREVAERIQSDTFEFADHRLRHSLLQYQLYGLLSLLKIQDLSLSGQPASGKAIELVRQFKYILNEQYATLRTVEGFARVLGYSVKTLDRACHEVEHCSARTIIDQRLFLEARRLLAHGQMTVAHVAIDLGFSAETNFVRFFRKYEGMTPSRFREIHSSQ